MMRILVDANVLISALVFGGKPRLLLESVAILQIQLVATRELQEEVCDVLIGKFAWCAARAELACAGVFGEGHWCEPSSAARVCRDPGDDYLIAAAAQAQANYIITGDRDLTTVGTYRGVEILTPGEFLARVRPELA